MSSESEKRSFSAKRTRKSSSLYSNIVTLGYFGNGGDLVMKFEWTDGSHILDEHDVEVKRMNHVVEIKSIKFESNPFEQILKLSKERYVSLETGEIKDYQLSENRGQNAAGLKDSFRKFRDLVNNNFTGAQNELFITLTYADNMTDSERLYADYKKFWQRFKRRFGDKWDYLTVTEPQGRGAWHIHGLLRRNDGLKAFIPNADLSALWRHGFVKVNSMEGIDNIGAYLSAYLTDLEIIDDNIGDCVSALSKNNLEIKVTSEDGKDKKYLKGGRLHMYPSGMNFYRKSKGIEHPEVEKMKYSDAKKIVGSANPHYSKTLEIVDEGSKRLLNRVTYEQYNLKR